VLNRKFTTFNSRTNHSRDVVQHLKKIVNMKLYLSKSHSDDDGFFPEQGKSGIIFSSKADVIKLCDFFEKVKNHIENNDKCHMHFRDSFLEWEKEKHIDIEINVD
jgi:hypothetical protein